MKIEPIRRISSTPDCSGWLATHAEASCSLAG